jgi:hypothetical protein
VSRGAATDGGAHLVRSALGAGTSPPGLPGTSVAAGDAERWEAPYRRWCDVTQALREALPELA